LAAAFGLRRQSAAATALSDNVARSIVQSAPQSGVALRLPPQSKIVTLHFMPADRIPWPHAPEHRLIVRSNYFVTASTCLRQHHFRGKARLAVLHRGLLKVAADFGWQ
jgi:hypothetical protein